MSLGSRPLVPSRLSPGGVSAHGARKEPTSVFGGYIVLMKLRVVELLLITTVPTMVLAEQGWPSWRLVAITLIGGTLAAGGANAINMVIDRDIDALMDRTKTRPLVTGLIRPREAMIFALALEAVAFAILWVGANLLAACLALSATLLRIYLFVVAQAHESSKHRDWRGSGSSSRLGGLGSGTKFACLGAIYPVHRHLFVDSTPFLGLGDPPRR